LLSKDEIKKGSFSLELGVSGAFATPFEDYRIQLADTNAATTFKVNSPVGEYGILYATNTLGVPLSASTPGITATKIKAGLLFYQAGIAVLTASIFQSGGLLSASGPPLQFIRAGNGINPALTSSAISGVCDDFRRRVYNLSFNNTTELNSTVYFCRANSNEFNYSSNPTYLTASKIRVKEGIKDPPISYITTVGLYSPDNELLAVAKLSEPIKKDPTEELTIRVRLDY